MKSEALLESARNIDGIPSVNERFSSVASSQPDAPFLNLVREDRVLTYGEVHDRALRLSAVLKCLGETEQSMVGIYLPTGGDYVVAWFGSLLGGHVDISISYELSGEMLVYAVNKADLEIVITDAEGYERLTDAAEEFSQPTSVLVVGSRSFEPGREAAIHRTVSNLSKIKPEDMPENTDAKDVDPYALASIRFTSGSTGRPKGIMMCQKHMMASAMAFCELTGLGDREVIYTPFPFHHVLATVTGVLSAMVVGGCAAVVPRFSASRYWDEIRQSGATVAQLLDPLVPILMKQPESQLDRKHNVRCLYTASGEYKAFTERFGVRIVGMFDMSELTVPMCYLPDEKRREGSCGRESGFFDVQIVDENDVEVSDGVDGQIVTRPLSPGIMMLGYYNDSNKTVNEWRNLWFHTGDMGYRDEDGYFYFTGRAGDRIRHNGVNISPEDIESVAMSHSSVKEAAAIAVPGSLGEDDIKIVFSAGSDVILSENDLLDYISQRIPGYMRPRYAERIVDFPKTETEKIQKAKLRQQGSQGLTVRTWDSENRSFIEDEEESARTPKEDLG